MATRCIVTIAIYLAGHSVFGQTQQLPTIASIKDAWQKREQQVESVRLYWTEEQVDAKGSLSEVWRLTNPQRKDDRAIPPADTAITNTCKLVIAGHKIRFEYTTQEWSSTTGRYEPTQYKCATDGTTCKVLRVYGENHPKPWPQGHIRADGTHLDVATARLHPALLAFRPTTKELRPHDIDRYESTGQQAAIHGEDCFELRERRAQIDVDKRLWISPEHFLVVRYLRTQNDHLYSKIDIKYSKTKDHHWFPTRWDIVLNKANGELKRAYGAVVSECEFNSAVAEKEFDLEFPPGTRVVDDRRNEDYIVRPDGTGKRLILPSDIGATYDQMLQTSPGKALTDATTSRFSVVLTGLLVTAGIATVMLIWFRSKRRGT